MIAINIPQKSIDWIAARLWRLTASKMSAVITSTGKLSQSEAATAAIDKLIAGITLANVMQERAAEIDTLDERQLTDFMANYVGDAFYGNRHTRRGEDMEPLALAALAKKLGEPISDVGMCIMGDNENGVVSCSPDGLIYRGGGLVSGAEAKGPCLHTYLGYVAAGTLPSQYKLQVHASMAICEVDSWHFCAIFDGFPLFHVEVKRDLFTDTLAGSLVAFRGVYADRYAAVQTELERMNVESINPESKP